MEKKQNHALTEIQQAFLEENFQKQKEKELFAKLSELGPEVDEKAFEGCLSALISKREADVFVQKVSEEELAALDGGRRKDWDNGCTDLAMENCAGFHNRNIYEGEFPNCAATVEDGSWCDTNDACYISMVIYRGMKSCYKAWD